MDALNALMDKQPLLFFINLIMANAKKPKKELTDHYNRKLAINGSFDVLINLSIGRVPKQKEERNEELKQDKQ